MKTITVKLQNRPTCVKLELYILWYLKYTVYDPKVMTKVLGEDEMCKLQ